MNIKLDLPLHDFNVAVGAMNFVAQAMSATSQNFQTQANAQLAPPPAISAAEQPEPGTAPTAPTNVVAVEFGGPTDAERA